MKTLRSAIVLSGAFWMLSGSPARAQVGGMGETQREVMRGAAEEAGLPAPAAPAAAPGSDTDAANALVTMVKTSTTNSAMGTKRRFMTTLGLRNTCNQPATLNLRLRLICISRLVTNGIVREFYL